MDESQQLKSRLENLPEDIQKTITSPHTGEVIRLISKKNHLDQEKQEALDNEIMFVLMGMEPLKNLVINLEENLNLQEEPAQELVADIHEYILKPIRESVRSLHAQGNQQPRRPEGSRPTTYYSQHKPQSSIIEPKAPETTEERKVEINKISEYEEPKTKEIEPTEAPSEKTEEQNKIYNSVIPREEKEPETDTEEKSPLPGQEKDSDLEFEPKEYHPGTIIDDKLSKIVKLSEHTES